MNFKRLLAITVLLCGSLAPAQTATPLVQPHWTFVDGSGVACAGCSLYSYLAGTTTASPTYTDATKVTQNANPVVLDVAGGANIWVGTLALKLVLKDALGNTIWTVDKVPAGGGGGGTVCGPATAIQIANNALTGFTCDSLITINTTLHTLNIGGALPAAFFSLTNLGAVVSSWTFDATSPLTAAASLAPIPLTDLPTEAADTALMNATGGAAHFTAVALPAGCTTALNYSTASHTWSCASVLVAPIALTSMATQAADTLVMNATGGAAAPTAVAMAATCLYGVNYNTATHAWTCLAATPLTSTGTGYYTTSTAILSGSPVTLYDEDVSTGALNNNTPTAITLPHAIPTQIMSCVCSDNGGRVQTGNNQPVGCNAGTSPAYPLATIQVDTPATTVTAYCRVRGY